MPYADAEKRRVANREAQRRFREKRKAEREAERAKAAAQPIRLVPKAAAPPGDPIVVQATDDIEEARACYRLVMRDTTEPAGNRLRAAELLERSAVREGGGAAEAPPLPEGAAL